MGCEGCFQTLKARNEQQRKILEQAKKEAVTSGEAYLVYEEPGTGEYRYLRVSAAAPGAYPNPVYVSPYVRDITV